MRTATYERAIGWLLVAFVIFVSGLFLNQYGTYWQLILGTILGYIMSRSSIGFVGMITSAYEKKTPQSFLNLLLLFFLAAVGTMVVVAFVPANWQLLIHPINGGLVLGGLLFGFGMTLTAFCSTTILMNLATNFTKAIITLPFFGLGIWLAFPFEEDADFVTQSWIQSSATHPGIYFPDLFASKLSGYFGGLLLTGLLCLGFAGVVIQYHKRKFGQSRLEPIFSLRNDREQRSHQLYQQLFKEEWSLTLGVMLVALVCSIMMWTTRGGWQAATPYGMWFGKGLVHIGLPPEQVAGYAHKEIEFFTQPLLSDANSVQNIGTLMGTTIYLLTSGQFIETFKSGLKFDRHELPSYALGGVVMGIGTRLAHGCNAGALLTPIANFSLSGWLILAMIMIGALIALHFKPQLTLSRA